MERYKDRAQRTRTLLDHREVCRRRTCVHCEYQSTLQGVCPQTGVRYWVARPSDSAGRVGVLEQQHCFSLAEGGPAAAVAAQLPRLAAECFEERQTQVPLWSRQTEEPAAEAWAEALTMAFVTCDQQLPDTELCSAVLSVITRSGIYIASCGTSRAVLGSAALDGVTVFCDEASVPHDATNDAERQRLAAGTLSFPPNSTWRGLGGHKIKEQYPGVIAMPDVVRIQYSEGRRLILLGSKNLWHLGPRLPVERAWEALRAGKCPALEAANGSQGDAVVLALLIPPKLKETISDDALLP